MDARVKKLRDVGKCVIHTVTTASVGSGADWKLRTVDSEVTRDQLAAGMKIYYDYENLQDVDIITLVERIYLAMRELADDSPPTDDDWDGGEQGYHPDDLD